MKRITLIMLVLALALVGCSDDLSSIQVRGRVISEVTGEPLANVPVVGLSQGVRGSGIFSSTYDIDRQSVLTNVEGNFIMFLDYEDYDRNFARIFKDAGDCCTEFLNLDNPYRLGELEGRNILITTREVFPVEVTVRNIDPFDENDSIYIHLVTVDPNNPYNRIFDVENFGVENQPRDPNQTGFVDNLYWVGEDVHSILRSYIQEGGTMTLHYSVKKNGNLESYETEPIPAISNGTAYYEILY